MIHDSLSNDLIGTQFPPIDISWNEQDTMLYALGVGAKPGRELDFLYEGRGPLVLPTYAVIPGMPRTPTAVEIGAILGSTFRSSEPGTVA